MHWLRTPLGATLIVALLGAGVVLGATAVQVHRGTTPPRHADVAIDFGSMLIRAEEVRFAAADDHELAAWWLRGRPATPPLILCHDAGSSKAALVNLAIALRGRGFSVLLFDFRGHGGSAGARSTLGLHEKRDVTGAVDFLAAQPELDTGRVGVYGVGMGAHAAVLAARDRPMLKVLVLDGLYPDVAYRLVREVYAGWDFAVDYLGFLPRGVFAVMNRTWADEQRAADVVEHLLGRDLLFLVPAGDTRLAEEVERMYASVPPQADADGNLVVLPATHRDGLYDDHLARYHERVADFFVSRLAPDLIAAD